MSDKESKELGPIPQEWFDDNRERFAAETEIVGEPAQPKRRTFKEFNQKHRFERVSGNEVRCTHCPIGWFDQGRMTIENKRIVAVDGERVG